MISSIFIDGMYFNDFKQLLQIFFIFFLIEIAIDTLLHCLYLNEPYCILNFFSIESGLAEPNNTTSNNCVTFNPTFGVFEIDCMSYLRCIQRVYEIWF